MAAPHKYATICTTANFLSVFDGESDHDVTTPDIEFSVPGLQKPLQLHSCVLCPMSALVCGVLKCQKSGKFEWPFDTTNTKDRDAVVKVLRFFYGETLKVETQEVCAVVAALWRFQSNKANEVSKQLIDFAAETATHDLNAGANMLRECVGYQECCDARCCELDRALARVVLSKQNMEYNFDKVVKGLLFELPPWILSKMEYGEPHTRCSELAVRLLYVAHNKDKLSEAEQSEVVSKVTSLQLNSKEIEHLRGLGLFDSDALIDLSLRVLKESETRLMTAEKVLREPAAYLWLTESQTTQILLHDSIPSRSTPIVDDARHMIMFVATHNIVVMKLTSATSGETKLLENVIPFAAFPEAVFDGTKFLYVVEENGQSFGRVDVDSWKFEELPSFPGLNTFEGSNVGCWHCGSVYLLDKGLILHKFDVSKGEWSPNLVHVNRYGWGIGRYSGPTFESKLLSNPQDETHLYAVLKYTSYSKRHVRYTQSKITTINLRTRSITSENEDVFSEFDHPAGVYVLEWLDSGFCAVVTRPECSNQFYALTANNRVVPLTGWYGSANKMECVAYSSFYRAFYFEGKEFLQAVLLPR